MGYLFDGGVVLNKIYDPNDYTNPLPARVNKSVLLNEGQVSTKHAPSDINAELLDMYTNNYAREVFLYLDRYRYSHPDPVPNNIAVADDISSYENTPNYIDPPPELKSIIETEIGEKITIERYIYTNPLTDMMARDYFIRGEPNKYMLMSTYKAYVASAFMDKASNKVYLPHRYTHIGNLLTVIAHELVYFDGSNNGNDKGWLPDMDNPKEFVLDLDNTTKAHPVHRVHHVRYRTQADKKLGYWFYNESIHGIGTPGHLPDVHGQVVYVNDKNESFPIMMIIDERKQVSKGHLGEIYKKQTENALAQIHLDLDEIMKALSADPDAPDYDSETDGNVDEDIKDAFILYAATLDSDDQSSLQYIYEHFRQLYYHKEGFIDQMGQAHAHWYTNKDTPGISWRLRFAHGEQLRVSNGRVDFSITLRWMSIKEKTGLIDNLLTLDHSLSSRPNDAYLNDVVFDPNAPELDKLNRGVVTGQFSEVPVYGSNTNVVEVGKIKMFTFAGQNYAEGDVHSGVDIAPETANDDLYILRKQITAGKKDNNGNWIEQPKYVEMVILGLYHRSSISNPNTDISAGGGGAIIEIITKISDSENGAFFLPISVNVIKQFNRVVQSEILYKNLCLSLTTYSKTKLPWYADEALMLAIRIVAVIISFGSSEGIIQAIFAAMKQLAYQFLIGAALGEIVKILMDLVGAEAALYLAAIAAVVAIYAGAGGQSFNMLFDLITSEQLLMGAMAIAQGVQEETQKEAEELQADIEAFELEQEKLEEDLQALKNELGPSYTVDYTKMDTRLPPTNFYETPGQFYDRTIHVSNPGVYALDSIDLYVYNNLQLPQYRGS